MDRLTASARLMSALPLVAAALCVAAPQAVAKIPLPLATADGVPPPPGIGTMTSTRDQRSTSQPRAPVIG